MNCGVGILINNTSPTINNCIVSNNSNLNTMPATPNSGIVTFANSFAVITNTMIAYNQAAYTAGLTIDTSSLTDGVSNAVVTMNNIKYVKSFVSFLILHILLSLQIDWKCRRKLWRSRSYGYWKICNCHSNKFLFFE